MRQHARVYYCTSFLTHSKKEHTRTGGRNHTHVPRKTTRRYHATRRCSTRRDIVTSRQQLPIFTEHESTQLNHSTRLDTGEGPARPSADKATHEREYFPPPNYRIERGLRIHQPSSLTRRSARATPETTSALAANSHTSTKKDSPCPPPPLPQLYPPLQTHTRARVTLS